MASNQSLLFAQTPLEITTLAHLSWVPGTVLSTLRASYCLFLTTNLLRRTHHYSHFTDEETEAQGHWRKLTRSPIASKWRQLLSPGSLISGPGFKSAIGRLNVRLVIWEVERNHWGIRRTSLLLASCVFQASDLSPPSLSFFNVRMGVTFPVSQGWYVGENWCPRQRSVNVSFPFSTVI